MDLFEIALEEADLSKKIKLVKKAIKKDYYNIDKRLYYIDLLDNKKKMNEYDILISDIIRTINKSFLEKEDLYDLFRVCKKYIFDSNSLGFVNEGIESGILLLKIDQMDYYNVRYLLVDNLFKLNRLNDYFKYVLPFNTNYDLFSHLIFFSITDNKIEFDRHLELLKEEDNNLYNIFINEKIDEIIYFKESYINNLEQIKKFL